MKDAEEVLENYFLAIPGLEELSRCSALKAKLVRGLQQPLV